MKTVTVFMLYFSACIIVEGTINVCIPLSSTEVKGTYDTNVALQELKTDITSIFKNDSLCFDHMDLDLKHPAISIRGPLDNVCIYNLLDFRLCLLDIDSESNKFDIFNLTFFDIKAEGIYNITGDFGDLFDMFGAGDFWIEFENFSVAMTNFSWNISNHEFCFPINIELDFYIIKNYFDNLMGDELEALINRVISAIGPEALEIIWSEMKDIFDKPLEDIINYILHHLNAFRVLNNEIKPTAAFKDKNEPLCYTNKG